MHAIYSSSIELAMDIRKYLVPGLPSEKSPLSQSLSPDVIKAANTAKGSWASCSSLPQSNSLPTITIQISL